jgi:hypothetical protein
MTIYFGVERHQWAFIIGGITSLFSIIISIHSIIQQIKYNYNPILKKYIIAIIGIVPIYALIAYLGLVDKNYTYAYDTIRECYEAFVIYSFFEFLLAYLSKGKSYLDYTSQFENFDEVEHMFPFKYILSKWTIGRNFLQNTMFGTFQYVIIKLLCGFAIFIMSFFDIYEDGKLSFESSHVYIVIIASISQIYAMYCLVLLYHQYREELKNINPFLKFISIKAVVFLTFWQGVIISLLVKIQIIISTQTYTTEQSSKGLQDFIICIEMLIASIFYKYSFPAKEFYNEEHIDIHYSSVLDHLMILLWPSQSSDQFIDVKV